MFAKISERSMRLMRWGLTLGWLILIGSLFFDPISAAWTAAGQTFAASTPTGCFQFQTECRPLTSYPMGARIFWGMVLPLVILTLLIFGHETWRRICPLSFLSQIPRALGWQQKRVVQETAWLSQNAAYIQLGLLFVGLNLRLLLVNSDRFLLGVFLLATIATAISVGFLFDGKTWCNYFCPMAPVQRIYSEPAGLFGSEAHTAPTKTITQSMCRTIDASGQEKSACVACKLNCMDIDAEASYWEGIRQPNRKLLYYGYVGLVIGFYLYFWLYSGNWNYLAAGVWNETTQWKTLLNPGFFIGGRAIPIPKLIAAPLTLMFAVVVTYAIGLWAERKFKRANKRAGYPISIDQVQSRSFAISAFIAFNLLFFLGVSPTLGYFPLLIQQGFSLAAVLLSSLWVAKTWQRSATRYHRERDANLLRRQLSKLEIDFSHLLEGRSLEDLNPDELYALAKVLPGFSQDYRLQVYRGILREAFEQNRVSPLKSQKVFEPMRQSLGIPDAAHQVVLSQLQLEAPLLFRQQPNLDATVYQNLNSGEIDPTVQRSHSAEPTQFARMKSFFSQNRKTQASENLEATVRRSSQAEPIQVEPIQVEPIQAEPIQPFLDRSHHRASKAVNGKTADDKTADDKTVDDKTADGKTADDKTVVRPKRNETEH